TPAPSRPRSRISPSTTSTPASAAASGSRRRSARSASTWATRSVRSGTTTGSRSISRLARPSEPRAAPRGPIPIRLVAALAGWLLAAAGMSAASAQVVDTLVAVVDSRTVAASDIALARALRTFGFTASAAPMARKDIDRYVDVVLILQESERIGISVEPAETDRAWDALVARTGGEGAPQRWPDGNANHRGRAPRAVRPARQKQKVFARGLPTLVFPRERATPRAVAAA